MATKYKTKILSLLKRSHLLSIAEIHKKVPQADYSTIFRNVNQLVKGGEIKKVVLDKDVVVYELNDEQKSHDHFICKCCGLVEVLKFNRSTLTKGQKFIVSDVLVKGECQKCSDKKI